MLTTIAVVIVVIALAYLVFGTRVDDSDELAARARAPRLTLTNPNSIIAGQCMQDSDCVYSSLHCLGNTCVVREDAPTEQQCNESHRCYNALIGLTALGIVANECVPLLAQHWDHDNCNSPNPYNCRGKYTTDSDGVTRCIPDNGGAVVSYTTYGGRSKLMTTLESPEVAQLFVDANPQVLSIDNVVV